MKESVLSMEEVCYWV